MATTEERPVVDLFDMLQPVCSEGSPDVHLAPYDWDQGLDGDVTLCDRSVSEAMPGKSYLKDGCVLCASRAIEAGIFAVRENEASVINLGRFMEARMPRETSDDFV
jgi:hypothetical protein